MILDITFGLTVYEKMIIKGQKGTLVPSIIKDCLHWSIHPLVLEI